MKKHLKIKPIEKLLNNMKLKNKFLVLYFICLIIPLVVTDGIIMKSVYEKELNSIKYDMEYVAGVYKNYFDNMLSSDVVLANSINMNSKVNTLLDSRYKNPYEFYSNYYEVITDSFLETTAAQNRDSIVVYVNNEDVLDSMFFKKLSGIKEKKWYKEFKEIGKSEYVSVYYDDDNKNVFGSSRVFYYIKELNHTKRGNEKILVIGHDSSSIKSDLKAFGTKYPVYILNDDYVMFSTEGDNQIYMNEEDIGPGYKLEKEIYMAGTTLKIIVVNESNIVTNIVKDNIGILVVLLIITVLLPIIVLDIIEETIIKRIKALEKAFGSEETNTFNSIKNIDGSDEIATLMIKYNKMVDITNELITTVYKDKIKEQESDIARQKAELLALQSQINPHFMFNALESIRMHSLLKGEEETAIMVDKLAIMERQNVEWGKDFVTIQKEIESIEAYLALQSYRFGDRLSYKIDIEEGCETYYIPKLTIVTFVENACVHGIESKSSPGWIFVRVFKGDKELNIEVEDTGEGMTDEEVESMLESINTVTIDEIKGKKHVGILNACLRLKMVTDNKVSFSLESEEGVGLSMIIKIPFDKLNNTEEIV